MPGHDDVWHVSFPFAFTFPISLYEMSLLGEAYLYPHLFLPVLKIFLDILSKVFIQPRGNKRIVPYDTLSNSLADIAS